VHGPYANHRERLRDARGGAGQRAGREDVDEEKPGGGRERRQSIRPEGESVPAVRLEAGCNSYESTTRASKG
jgi:hypothetical protein